jgi:probable sodium:solute symporter
MSQENLTLFRTGLAAWNEGNYDAIVDMCHPDVEWTFSDRLPDATGRIRVTPRFRLGVIAATSSALAVSIVRRKAGVLLERAAHAGRRVSIERDGAAAASAPADTSRGCPSRGTSCRRRRGRSRGGRHRPRLHRSAAGVREHLRRVRGHAAHARHVPHTRTAPAGRARLRRGRREQPPRRLGVRRTAHGEAAVGELEVVLGVGTPPLEAVPGLSALTTLHATPAEGIMAAWQFVTLVACMMIGTASLPHILMRYFTTPTVRDARNSVAWSLFFIFLLYFSAPALATFSKLQMLDPTLPTAIIGKPIEEVMALDWIRNWSEIGLLAVIDQNGDGILQINEFFLNPDIIVLATPEMAGLPYVISGLVAAGGMAAAMSTADGLLLAMANALSHDLYYKIIDPKAETRKRLLTSRILLVGIGAAGALVASMQLTGILGAVAWAFCFAMSGLFFPLVLGVWWKRANRQGALAGMLVGLFAGWWYLLAVRNPDAWYGIAQPWLGLNDLRFGIVGIAASLVAMVAVTYMFPAPDQETQDMVDELRIPSGKTILGATS